MEKKPELSAADRDKLRQQLVRELKPQLEDFIRQEIKRQLGSKATRDNVQEITLDVLLRFFRSLGNRSTFFKNL